MGRIWLFVGGFFSVFASLEIMLGLLLASNNSISKEIAAFIAKRLPDLTSFSPNIAMNGQSPLAIFILFSPIVFFVVSIPLLALSALLAGTDGRRRGWATGLIHLSGTAFVASAFLALTMSPLLVGYLRAVTGSQWTPTVQNWDPATLAWAMLLSIFVSWGALALSAFGVRRSA
jgi:hypothetical protein